MDIIYNIFFTKWSIHISARLFRNLGIIVVFWMYYHTILEKRVRLICWKQTTYFVGRKWSGFSNTYIRTNTKDSFHLNREFSLFDIFTNSWVEIESWRICHFAGGIVYYCYGTLLLLLYYFLNCYMPISMTLEFSQLPDKTDSTWLSRRTGEFLSSVRTHFRATSTSRT